MNLTTVTKWAIVDVISFNKSAPFPPLSLARQHLAVSPCRSPLGSMSGPTASRLERGWLHERPMNEEEDEVTQARLIQAARKDRANYPQAVPGRTWIYRQSVKAEPWDKTVRDKISDPAWSGFFLHYGDSYDYSLPICRDANLSKPGCNTWPACDRSQPPKCSKMCESTKPPPCCLTATLLFL